MIIYSVLIFTSNCKSISYRCMVTYRMLGIWRHCLLLFLQLSCNYTKQLYMCMAGYLSKACSVNQYILICLSQNKACFTTSLIILHTSDRPAIAYFSNSNHQSRDFTTLLASQITSIDRIFVQYHSLYVHYQLSANAYLNVYQMKFECNEHYPLCVMIISGLD